ncbi:MAG: hypothetical protein ACFCU3_03160, partial [Verrucomicrobiales bacterium]
GLSPKRAAVYGLLPQLNHFPTGASPVASGPFTEPPNLPQGDHFMLGMIQTAGYRFILVCLGGVHVAARIKGFTTLKKTNQHPDTADTHKKEGDSDSPSFPPRW